MMFVNSPDMGGIVILVLAKELSLTGGCDILVLLPLPGALPWLQSERASFPAFGFPVFLASLFRLT